MSSEEEKEGNSEEKREDEGWEAQSASRDEVSLNASFDEDVSGAISKLKAEVEENKDKYLRALADLENFRKRSTKERSELLKYQGEKVLADLLEVVDNLELAMANADSDPAKFKAGIELIHKNFVDILGRWSVKGESAVGKRFDPAKHEAISKVAVDDAEPGTVINELKKAYYYKDKLLRPGEVVVVAEKIQSIDPNGASKGESDQDAENTSEKTTA